MYLNEHERKYCVLCDAISKYEIKACLLYLLYELKKNLNTFSGILQLNAAKTPTVLFVR